MSSRTGWLLAVLAGTVLLVGACGDSEGTATPAPAPAGSRTVTCDLPAGGGVTITLSVPEDSVRTHDYGAQEEGDEDTCSWSVPGAHKTPTSIWVTVVGDSADASLQAERDEQAEFLNVGGDEEITDLRLDEDVPVFDTTGDRLRYQCYCDGLPELDYLAQADGVRLGASVADPEARAQIEDLLDQVLPTVRVQD